ncbi:zinc-binding protein A33-like [Alosa pseudoharengus]|uniref:zinc-binding protein A33-like n=1 Tax=Alosa pseudoharengus TaxID=34774 RepID=UPI003F8A8823
MDLQSSLLEQNLSCPVCRDIFQDPVFLLCSHSFCRHCLLLSWKEKDTQECPVCRESISMKQLPSNLVLKTLCEDYLQERSQQLTAADAEVLCRLHGERLKLFCLEDKELACLVCRDSKKHTDHKFCPIDEAAQDLKCQARHTELQIKGQFQVLYQFLHDEEMARITALREEEEQKSYMMMKKIQELSYLSETIHAMEMEMKMADVPFLQNYSSTMQRAQSTLQDPGEVSAKLINVASHLSNLNFSVWEKMQGIIEYAPVTLDPNTAHPCLSLSDDLTSLQLCTEIQQLPDNPERFDGYTSVLASEGFTSGTHSWEVEVGDCPTWALGVVSESECKNREQLSKFGLWYIGCANGKYGKGYSTELLTPLTVNQEPQRIRVQLEWDGGRVSFSDADTGGLLHSFTNTFTETVYPYFCNVSSVQPLRILTLMPSVNL